MTIKALYPTVRPSLNLDFAKTKALDPRVTFSRASTGTFVGSNGLIQTAASGAARFDHNPETGESLGLLLEEERTNRVLSSQSLPFVINSTYWTVTNLSTGAPNGEGFARVNCVSFSATTLTFNYDVSGLVSGSSVLTVSLYARSNDTNVQLGLGNPDTVILGTTPALTSEWVRYSGTFTWSGSNVIRFFRSVGSISAGQSFDVCMVSIEAGAFPTSYIPTVASTVTRAADVATLANTGSSIFPTSAFTTVNSPFGTAGGGSTVKLVGPTVKRTAVYASDLTQAQINALASVNDDFWRWRVLGTSFALPNFTTDGSVTVDWGDGVVETLTTAAHTFTNGGGYHDIGFRLNSGTYFKPYINDNASIDTKVVALGPAPESMKLNAQRAFRGCNNLEAFDATVDATGGTIFQEAWRDCSNLTSFPLIDTSSGTNFNNAWHNCYNLTSFPLIDTAAGTSFNTAWHTCSNLTSFPLINTAAGTSFYAAWYNCSSLTSFPLIDTSSGTSFSQAWYNCSSLTSFPLINTAAGTSFYAAWGFCSSLTSFPLIDTAAGTNFNYAWQSCSSLTSFPLIDTSSGTSFGYAWRYCSSLTSFPLINTAAGTDFTAAWDGCSSLTSFPSISTAAGTNFFLAWSGCSGLTSFPLIDTAAGTNFSAAWYNCTSLTSFPLIDTAAGTNFGDAWRGCSSLTSFPLINTAAGTTFYQAWSICTSLTSFPANMFNTTGTLISTAFTNAFFGCALTATSIENILTSLVTNGQSNITLSLQGGTNAGASTWTANAVTAYNTLISRGWTITRNA